MMYRLLGIVGLCVVVGAVPPAMAEAGGGGEDRGRYEGVAASDNTIWVVDTQTGKVRRCVQDFADQAPNCSAYSK